MRLLLSFCASLSIIFAFSSCNDLGVHTKGHEPVSKDSVLNIPKDVYCAYLDKDNYIWFGTTTNGAYRYDGQNFKHYSDKDGLLGYRVSCIYQVANGDIWFGTDLGIFIFNGILFSHLKIPEYKTSTDWLKNTFPAVNPNEVQSIAQDNDGIFWIGTNGAGVYQYDGKNFTNHLSEIGNPMPDGLKHNIVQSIAKDKSGNLWFASMSHGGANKYDGQNFTQYMPEDGLSDDQIRTIYIDRQSKIWFGFNGNRKSGLTVYNGDTFQTFTEEDGICSKNIRAIYDDAHGNIWFGGMQGLCIYDGKDFHRFYDDHGDSFERILFIQGDDKGNIWFGGINGIHRYEGDHVVEIK